ncbi:MAG: CoA-binding protein [Anaerolineae bacterium]|jgi:hypothetical protein|nr:CoA-binding protein [Anaerolineae bacterium]
MGNDLNQDLAARRDVLLHSPIIAIVGRSNDHYYTSYEVGEYLIEQGFTVYNVNPNIDDVDGQPVYESLQDLPGPVDLVVVFRDSRYLNGVVTDALQIGAKTVWAQLNVHDDAAREHALNAGLNFAMDLCIRTEHQRLFDHLQQG